MVREKQQKVLLVGHSNLHLLEDKMNKEVYPEENNLVEKVLRTDWFVGLRSPKFLCNEILPLHRDDVLLNIISSPVEKIRKVLPCAYFDAIIVCNVAMTQAKFDTFALRSEILLRPGGQLIVSSPFYNPCCKWACKMGSNKAFRVPDGLEVIGQYNGEDLHQLSAVDAKVKEGEDCVWVAKKVRKAEDATATPPAKRKRKL